MKKVNLGSGNIKSNGWINIDIVSGENVDIVHDLRESLPFKNSEIDEFYSHHVLEHFTPMELEKLLRECFRCLKISGEFNARVPNIEAAMRNYLDGKHRDNMMACFYGDNPDEEPYCVHRHLWGWTPETMKEILEKTGFKIKQCEAVGSDSCIPAIDVKATKEV